MATTYKIHPAIGVARVGNSPDGFFVGPERPDERPAPADGFKDDQLRVKRQAARFRIFAHHDDGSVEEVTAPGATISWTVHLVNAKAAHPDRGNPEPAADLTIDPGPRTVEGPGGTAVFDTGTIRFAGQQPATVPLGEIRSDAEGRLVVLGGAGASNSPAGNPIEGFWTTPGWYDDVADGPVTARLTLPNGETPAVEGAWVLVAPPKFAPHQDSVITLYDRVFDRMVTLGLLPAPTTTSYTRDVYPVLRRAADTRWVAAVGGAHAWAHPITAQRLIDRIVGRLRPQGDMPALAGEDAVLTAVQAAHLGRWKAGTYTQDWAGEPQPNPAITPDGLDRAALDGAVGGAFFPGIEAGGLAEGARPILDAPYAAAFRLDHTRVAPGAVTGGMALPWQADFQACADTWWPVPRPLDVFENAAATDQIRWDRDVTSGDEMAASWHTLGFVVATDGGRHVETEHSEPAPITQLTHRLDFADVAQGPLGMIREQVLAIRFAVRVPATLELDPPTHPQLVALTRRVTVDPTEEPAAVFTVAYRTGVAPSALPTQVLTVRDTASDRTWQVEVDANTVPRPGSATVLVLDRSGSMAADGRSDAVRRAAPAFAALLPAGDGLGVVTFDADAEVLQPVLPLGEPDDAHRAASVAALTGPGLDPRGGTSIGDGVTAARDALARDGGPYAAHTLVVVSDGVENQPRALADVVGELTDTAHAVELGRPNSIGVPALTDLAGNTGGTLQTTAEADLDDALLQVVADVSGAEIVATATGRLTSGAPARIPFRLTDVDGGFDVVLRTASPEAVDFRLQTPGGLLLEPWRAGREPSMRFGVGPGLAWFRIALPVALEPARFEQGGTWHVVVTPGEPRREPDPAGPNGADTAVLRGLRSAAPVARRGLVAAAAPEPPRGIRSERERAFAVISQPTAPQVHAFAADEPAGVPYALRVHAWSAVTLQASIVQDGFAPGAQVTVGAGVFQSGEPVTDGLVVTAEVVAPSGRTTTQVLRTGELGDLTTSFAATEAGTYRVRVGADGRARNGQQFTRERVLTAATWAADLPVPPEG